MRRERWFLAAVAALGVGCGHPATDAECQEILRRIVDLELASQGVSDPNEVARRRVETLAQGDGGDLVGRNGCVGKRITDGAMACVRQAKSADEVTETCLR